MVFFLGVDGGGSGCRAVLTDAEGLVLGRGQAGPANIVSAPEVALANILAAATQAMAGQCAPGQVWAGLGLAGANLPEAVARIAPHLPFARARVESDGLTTLKGALGAADGIVAAIGTGSVFISQRGGVLRQIGGWGLTLGDEGSGAWIGRAFCARALRALDGFVPQSALTQALLAEQSGGPGLVAFAQRAQPADFAALVPRLLAMPDDSAAAAVLAAARAEVGAAIALLQQGGPALPVVCLGGLGPAFAPALAELWAVIPAQGTALDGALWLARHAG
ncbi:ATPase [Candidatus Falkowbacteria bacterium]|nr:ATPase [Candidatus Falkowbacteria bacterium]